MSLGGNADLYVLVHPCDDDGVYYVSVGAHPPMSDRLVAADEPLRDLMVLARGRVSLDVVDHPVIDKMASSDVMLSVHQLDLALLRAACSSARRDNAGTADSLVEAMRVVTATGMIQRLIDERHLLGPFVRGGGGSDRFRDRE